MGGAGDRSLLDAPARVGRGLAEEVDAVQRARAAARSGDPDRAVAVLDELERRRADGALGEERRVVRIVALCASSRAAEGRAASERFLRELPASIHAEHVRVACRKPVPPVPPAP